MRGPEAIRVLLCGTNALVGGSEAANGDGVGEDFARDSRAITVFERELLAKVLSRTALGGIVCGVARASIAAVLAGKEEVAGTSVEINCLNVSEMTTFEEVFKPLTPESDRRSANGDLALPELAVVVLQGNSARSTITLLGRTVNIVRVNIASVLLVVLEAAVDLTKFERKVS